MLKAMNVKILHIPVLGKQIKDQELTIDVRSAILEHMRPITWQISFNNNKNNNNSTNNNGNDNKNNNNNN